MLEDTELKKMIGSNVYPAPTDCLDDCVLYNFYTEAQSDGAQKVRLQITIVCSTMEKTLQIEERIKTILLTLGDKPLTTNILQVALNGGGTLYDYAREKHHRILYLILQYQYLDFLQLHLLV